MRELSSLWHFSRRFSSIDGGKVERGKRKVGGDGEGCSHTRAEHYKQEGKFYLGPENF